VLYIVSIVVSVFIFSACMRNVTMDAEYTAYSKAEDGGDRIFYAQNMGKAGRLFSVNDKGRVLDMFSSLSVDESRIEAISVTGENVYAVVSTLDAEEGADPDDEDPKLINYFRVICLDRKLKVQTMTERFSFDEDMIISGLSAEAGGIFLTYITPDGSAVRVFSMSLNELKIRDALSGGGVNIDSIRSRYADNGRFFVQAKYYDGDMEVRTDADAPAGIFAPNERVANAVENMKLSPGQLIRLYYQYIVWYLVLLIIWMIVLFLLVRMFVNRNRSFYYVAVVELMLLIICGVGTWAVSYATSHAKASEHTRFAVLSMMGLADQADINDNIEFSDPDFYDSERYQQIRNDLTDFIRLEGNRDIFYDVLIVRLIDSKVVSSASGRNLQDVAVLYGDPVDDIEMAIYRGEKYSAEEVDIESQNYMAVAVPDGDTVPDYMLVGIINTTTDKAAWWKDNSRAFLIFLITFALSSLITLNIWFLQNRDLRIFETALADTAYGRELRERPLIVGSDIKDMWDSLSEINKRVDEIQYSKLRILEAYYRFAPKNIEKVLHKDSILEVKNGDRISLRGTIVTVNAVPAGGGNLDRYDRIIGRIGRYQEEHGCILIGKSPDMNVMQFLLQENEKNTVGFITDLFNTHNQDDDHINMSASVLFDNCRFGIAGSDEETTLYLEGDHKHLVEYINRVTRTLNLSIVISEDIKEREQITGPLRFIGYVGCGSDEGGVPLYEVLDAYPARVRSVKIANLNKFDQALRSFYDKDFYISRTMFSDILKEMPDDALVKWYVFESDRYLNEIVDDNTFKNLKV
ncbi:MAG: hypothetical protein J5509_10990, partial [Lachnospiraceae bacterium]|nr:hypothetical protein [Lachnospiraceae bacterium]